LSKLPSCVPQLLWMQEKHELPVAWLTHAPPPLPLLLQASAAVIPTAAATTMSTPPIVVFIVVLPEGRSREARGIQILTRNARTSRRHRTASSRTGQMPL
jgi:hypothetical protein